MDLLRLTRPVDVILFLAAAAVGGALVGGGAAFEGEALGRLLLAMLSATLVGAGSNVVNDLYDAEIDRVNSPHRPLASGAVAPEAAWAFWGALSVGGVVLGALVSPLHAAVSAGSVALLWTYSAWLKGTVLLGNLTVGAVIALGVVFGGLAVGPPTAALWAGAALGGWVTFSREIVKDVHDVEGDRAGGAVTLPLAWGERRATGLAVGCVGAALVAYPAAAGAVGAGWYVWGLPLAGCLLAAGWVLGAALAAGAPLAEPSVRASRWLKVGLAVGIVGLVVTRLGA